MPETDTRRPARRRIERARLGAYKANGVEPDDPRMIAAEQELRHAGLRDYIADTLAARTPLSDEQRISCAVMLWPPFSEHSSTKAMSA